MDDDLKGKLDRAFDEGLLVELPEALLRAAEADVEAARYLAQLRALDEPLSKPPKVKVPEQFGEMVIRRLPSTGPKKFKAISWRDFFMPLYIAALLIVVVVFRDAFGITALLELAGKSLAASGEGGLEFAFILVSSAGILLATWVFVGSFFGIRSRRTSR